MRAIPVDAELAAWIAWRIKNTSKRLPLPALFPNPTAVSENAERRWEAGTLRKEWNRSAKRVGVKVKMYEGTKHSFASDACAAVSPSK